MSPLGTHRKDVSVADMAEENVTVFRPDAPRMTTFETSGGLKLTAFECDGGHHVWLHVRGQEPKGRCQCGKMVYQPATPATACPASSTEEQRNG